MTLVKELLTNNIITAWIAPIITGVIASIIIIKIQNFRNNKLISEINKRYLNDIKEYIINYVKIKPTLISDIRKSIVLEYRIKEKYIYNELMLRNKLILDITENQYINKSNKIELINFTYDTFKSFENKDSTEYDFSMGYSLSEKIIITISFLFLIFGGIVLIFANNGNSRFMIFIENSNWIAVSKYISMVVIIINTIIILKRTSIKEKFINLFFDEVEISDDKSKEKSKED